MTRLQDQAMIAILHQRAWSSKATDRDIARGVETENDAEQGTMRVIKELAPPEYISPIRKIMRIGKAEHDRLTVAGFTRGQSILATANFDRYALSQSMIRDECIMAVRRFEDIYPEILELAPKRMGKAFKLEDFPAPYQIKSFFEYSNRFLPIPTVHDWRLDGINQEDAYQMREQVEAEVRVMYNEATKEVFERARTVLENIAKQARDFGVGPNGSPLRDATIENLKEMSELVCSMNIGNDPLLAEVGREMVKEFSEIVPEELRRNDKMRHDISTAAQRILARINGRQED